MRVSFSILLSFTLGLLIVIVGCGGDSTPNRYVPPNNSILPIGTFAFARTGGGSAALQLAHRQASRKTALINKALLRSEPPAVGSAHLYLMDHHGAVGSEIPVAGSADYQSIFVSSDRRKLLYSAYANDGYYQIFMANADGSEISQLTHDAEDHWEAQLSPDGTRVVFVRAFGGLATMSSSGGAETSIPTDRFYVAHPTFAPNGKILFEGFDSEFDALFTVNQDGSNLLSFSGSTNTAYYYANLAVSPDGTQVVFSDYDQNAGTENIYIADFDASALENYGTVLSNVTRLTTADPVANFSSDPMFIDDRIVFVAYGEANPGSTSSFGEIYSMKYDGSELKRLTQNSDFEWFVIPWYYYYY